MASLLKVLPILLGLINVHYTSAVGPDIIFTFSYSGLLQIAINEPIRMDNRIDDFAQRFHTDAMAATARVEKDGQVLIDLMQKAKPQCQKLNEVTQYIDKRQAELMDLADMNVVDEMKTDSAVVRGYEQFVINQNWLVDKIHTCVICDWDQISMSVFKKRMINARKDVQNRLDRMETTFKLSLANDSRLQMFRNELTRCERFGPPK